LAAALALPIQLNGGPFPFRDLIVVTAFSVVLGTLVIQGLTLGPLLGVLNLEDDRMVEREVALARERVMQAALATFGDDASDAVRLVRQEFVTHVQRSIRSPGEMQDGDSDHDEIHRRALAAARRTLLELRESADIGDDAFHVLEEEFDWIEMGTIGRDDD
jgi:CPA1 family monovalent cation:H+ antiporter